MSQYIFRMIDKLEFGLPEDITDWDESKDCLMFYSGKDLKLIAPKANLVCVRIAETVAPVANSNGEAISIEDGIAGAGLSPEVKAHLLATAKHESSRYIVKEEEGDVYLIDTESPSEKWKVGLTGDISVIKGMVDKANSIQPEREAGQDATIVIRITDQGSKPSMTVDKEAFQGFMNDGGYKFVHCPVLQNQKGDHIRFKEEGDSIFLYPAVLDTKVKTPSGLVDGTTVSMEQLEKKEVPKEVPEHIPAFI